jgi:hypothetical protein
MSKARATRGNSHNVFRMFQTPECMTAQILSRLALRAREQRHINIPQSATSTSLSKWRKVRARVNIDFMYINHKVTIRLR